MKYIYPTSWTYYNLTIITTEKDQKHYLECYTIPETAQLTREVYMPDTAVNLYKGVKFISLRFMKPYWLRISKSHAIQALQVPYQ